METAQITERFQYSPYGVLVGGDASTTPFLFNGMYGVMSDSNELYYMRARYYSPEIRRFVNQDVLYGNLKEGQTLNRYAYVTGQPVSYVDPFGLIGEPVISTICGVALFEPTPVGEVVCICALIAVGGIVVHSASSTPTTTKPFVAPGEGIQWPGDCQKDYLNHLQDQKDLLCNMLRGCKSAKNETCPSVEAKMLAGYNCQAIRMRIMNECFRGGDETHRKELKKVNDALMNCGFIALKVCP